MWNWCGTERGRGGVRLPDVPHDIDWYLAAVERDLGGPLAELSREDKQRAVKLLNDRGAFQPAQVRRAGGRGARA